MPKRITNFILDFIRLESAAGILLFFTALLAIVIANTPAFSIYQQFFATPVEIRVGALEIAKPLLLWVNDGLMAVFFFLIGLELKRELTEGELSDKRNIVLPGAGAIGGMLAPAGIYLLFNAADPLASRGWAIPAGTDIAFALGVLKLLGNRVPLSVKIFLTSLAIFDDIGAIVIIAVFYTSKISLGALAIAGLCLPVLFALNKRGVTSLSPYVLVGTIMWVATLKSGVHATLAGVVLAMFIPMRDPRDSNFSPLKTLEHDLHSVVAYFVLPVFAFANAGISFAGISMEQLTHSVTLGIALGLFLGKQLGIFVFCAIAIKLSLAKLPDGMSWSALYGSSALSGIGFTMSLFIGSLAFANANLVVDERMGILLGSLASGILGYFLLRKSFSSS
ncbi:Na+/H+ antiporter NhaA [Congregibacter variabilis]|uniref:Na(+)/H(+) antiporter NhaA n=1 Tax=Congregibacter variabilis TaxID=3081200 RepID=A0ABZ0I7P3_9GAMM|nr:Na+/H+ antiporter NhaA [Congregibacter sp. IMCC43200]